MESSELVKHYIGPVSEWALCSKGHVFGGGSDCLICVRVDWLESELAYTKRLLTEIRQTGKRWKKNPEIRVALDAIR